MKETRANFLLLVILLTCFLIWIYLTSKLFYQNKFLKYTVLNLWGYHTPPERSYQLTSTERSPNDRKPFLSPVLSLLPSDAISLCDWPCKWLVWFQDYKCNFLSTQLRAQRPLGLQEKTSNMVVAWTYQESFPQLFFQILSVLLPSGPTRDALLSLLGKFLCLLTLAHDHAASKPQYVQEAMGTESQTLES